MRPLFRPALNNLAWLLGQKRATADEALTFISHAIAKHGPDPDLLDTRAMVFLTLGRPADALKDLDRIVSAAPTAARYYHLAKAHRAANNREAAESAWASATRLGLSASQLHPTEHPSYRDLAQSMERRN